MPSELIDNLKNLVEPIVSQRDMFLVDIEVKQGNETEVWILVDSETSGVNLDLCSEISRELSRILEEKDLFSSPYRLNVSSPGLSRPLSDKRQYGKNAGRKAKVKYKDGDEYITVEGILEKGDGDHFSVETKESGKVTVAYSDVIETKIIPNI